MGSGSGAGLPRGTGLQWLALFAAGTLVAGALAFVTVGGNGLEHALAWFEPAGRGGERASIGGAQAAALPVADPHSLAEEELLAEIRRFTARPAPREVEHILALRRGGVPDATLEPLVDALLGDDPLVAASVKGWMHRTPRALRPAAP